MRVFRGVAGLGGRSCLWKAPGNGQSTHEALTSSWMMSHQDGAAQNSIALDSYSWEEVRRVLVPAGSEAHTFLGCSFLVCDPVSFRALDVGRLIYLGGLRVTVS